MSKSQVSRLAKRLREIVEASALVRAGRYACLMPDALVVKCRLSLRAMLRQTSLTAEP